MEASAYPCRLRPSLHASDRMISQGIGHQEIMEAIVKGAKRREGEKIVSRFRGKEVVFVKRPCRYFLVTVYWITK